MHQALVVTRSTCEPMSRTEAKLWLKLSTDDTVDDALIDALVAVSRRTVEERTRRLFYQSSCQLRLDACPDDSTGVIKVPVAPLKSVASITSYDTTDAATVMSSSEYTVDIYSEPGRISLRNDGAWPTDLRTIDGVVISLTAGYSSSTSDGTTGIPVEAYPMVQATKLLLAHLYENRQAVVVGNAASVATEVPLAVDYLLAPLLLPEVEG